MLLGHRFYDPSVGRFISKDPAGSGQNWYAYASNNPTMSLDPTGLQESNHTSSYYEYQGADGQMYAYVEAGSSIDKSSLGGVLASFALTIQSFLSGYKPSVPQAPRAKPKTIRKAYKDSSWAVTGHIGGDLHFGLGPWNLDLNGGLAADITDHGAHAEFYNGYATGAGPKGIGGLGLGLGFSPLSGGLGWGSLQGFNGAGKSLSLESPWAAGSWDWNDSYHGFTIGANPLPLIWGIWYNKTQTQGTRFAGNDFDP